MTVATTIWSRKPGLGWLSRCAVLILLMHGASVRAADGLDSCRVEGFAQQVRCGQIQRPLNPDQPHGKQIAIHFIVLPARDKNKEPDPIFLLAGGPGQSAIKVASWIQAVFEKLQRRHDLVFVDQRGTGQSAPLECPESDGTEGIGDADYGIRQMLKCRDQLEKLPWGDLRFYTTGIAMQDLDAVRSALHYSTIDLIGISYGTRAALEYQRQYPQHVRRSILDGAVQPDQMLGGGDAQKALTSLMNDCATDPRCQKAYPNLRNDWKELLDSLPRQTALTHPRLGNQIKALVNRNDVLHWVTGILYSPVNSAGLPHAIEQARQGNFNPLLALSGSGALPNPGSVAMGMHFSTVCSEEYDNLTRSKKPEPGNDFSDLQTRQYLKVCAQWPRGAVPAGFYVTPHSATPVLLLSGGIDPVTPAWHAQQIAGKLGSMARQLVLQHAGHGMLQQTCLTDLATAFINAPTDRQALDIDTACMAQIPRPSVWIAPAVMSEVQP